MTSLVKCQCLSYSMHLCRLLLIYLHFELLYFNKFCCFVGIEQSFAVWKDLIKDPKFIRAMQFLDLIFIRITLWWNWFSFNLHFIFLALEWHRTKFFQSCQLSTPFESRIDSWFFWKKAHWINSSTLNYWVVATLMSLALCYFWSVSTGRTLIIPADLRHPLPLLYPSPILPSPHPQLAVVIRPTA